MSLRGIEKPVENLLSESFLSSRMISKNGWCPNTDIFETKNEFIIRLELSGMTKEDISITSSEQRLTIRGKREDKGPRGKVYYHQMEICYGFFERTFVLPNFLDGEKLKAYYKSGFLEIFIPKKNSPEIQPTTIIIEN